jgi:hypothetical protein
MMTFDTDQAVAIVQFGNGHLMQQTLDTTKPGWFPTSMRALGREMTRIDSTNRYGGIAGLVVVAGKEVNQYTGNEAIEVMFS